MDLKGGPSGQSSKPALYAENRSEEYKEVAWAFLGLILWSAVLIGGVLAAAHVLGHFVFHLW
jgi:hypothetical protein